MSFEETLKGNEDKTELVRELNKISCVATYKGNEENRMTTKGRLSTGREEPTEVPKELQSILGFISSLKGDINGRRAY